jgi:hypothetical protein
MSQKKRQPLQDTTFFRLTPGVRDRLLEINLTAAEWRVWCYLVSLDPFGDRGTKFSPAELMLKCGIKKSTYFAAKAKFQKLGLFDFRDGVTKVFNLQTTLDCTPRNGESNHSKTSNYSQQAKFIESEISESKSEISESKSEISESKSEISESESEISDNQGLKHKPCNVSKMPQTLKTYSEFKRSLSEDERENFLNFVEEKIKNLEKPINDLEAWLASQNAAKQNRWEVYYSNYQEQKKCAQSRTNKQNQGSASLNLAERQNVIVKFQERMGIKQPIDEEPSPEEVNSQEYQQKLAEFNQLLDNPPERENVELQQHREKIAEFKRQEEEIRRANREAAEERAKQQNSDVEQRKAEIRRQLEEFNQRQQSQNPENTSEINLENLEDE